MKLQTCISTLACLSLAAVINTAAADTVGLNFFGSDGAGLLPGNENAGVVSSAFGDEAGAGLLFDTDLNVLSFDFEFSGLTGGLNTSIASGIHFHQVDNPLDPLNSNGGIVFNLNSGADANVALTTPLLANGATSGRVTGKAMLTESQEASLLDGLFYLNIHSNSFAGGELRGNLVVPEPSSLLLALPVLCLPLLRRRWRA